MENKQTAIEWLEKNIGLDMSPFELIKCFDKAKEMEKQQIIDAYNYGQQIPPFDYAEQYYNETHGKGSKK